MAPKDNTKQADVLGRLFFENLRNNLLKQFKN